MNYKNTNFVVTIIAVIFCVLLIGIFRVQIHGVVQPAFEPANWQFKPSKLSESTFKAPQDLFESFKLSEKTFNISKKTNVCEKNGNEFGLSYSQIRQEIKPFFQVYNRRPSKENKYGSRMLHQFALWCIIRHLKPKYIIESGVNWGLGTWLIRQAAPTARLIMLDPLPLNHLTYKDNREDSVYFFGRKFKDFYRINWKELVEPKETLVFFDDHQNHIRRLREAKTHGFVDIMFDDNYKLGGDTFSFKTVCDLLLRPPNKPIPYHDASIGIKRRNITASDLQHFQRVFNDEIEVYYEFPRMFGSGTDRFSDDRNFVEQVNDDDVIGFLKNVGLTKFPPDGEIRGFSYISYVKIK